jgi:hypothetical protein
MKVSTSFSSSRVGSSRSIHATSSGIRASALASIGDPSQWGPNKRSIVAHVARRGTIGKRRATP